MKVSIITPTYNRAYIIGEALKSIFAQTYSDYELIVVDDGSQDNTEEMIRTFPDPRLNYIRHPSNRGCSAAYNTGIKAATGALVGFLDSDDVWKPDFLAHAVSLHERNPAVDVVFTDVEIMDGNRLISSTVDLTDAFTDLLGQRMQGREYIINSRQMYLCLLREVPIKPSAVLTKLHLFDRAGMFNESWPSGTDWDLFLRFSRSATFGYIDLPLVTQRRHSDCTHQIFRIEDKEFLLQLFLNERNRLLNDTEAHAIVTFGIANHYRNLGYSYLSCGQRRKAASLYFKAFGNTGDFTMLLRLALAFAPSSLRNLLKRLKALQGTTITHS